MRHDRTTREVRSLKATTGPETVLTVGDAVRSLEEETLHVKQRLLCWGGGGDGGDENSVRHQDLCVRPAACIKPCWESADCTRDGRERKRSEHPSLQLTEGDCSGGLTLVVNIRIIYLADNLVFK